MLEEKAINFNHSLDPLTWIFDLFRAAGSQTFDISNFGIKSLVQFNPKTIRLLQESTRNADYEQYKEYCKAVDDQSEKAFTLRGLMEFNSDRKPIPLDEVESAENILKRFATGAMSFGSISWEAHTTLAIAMNRIGSKSIIINKDLR